MGRSVTPRPLNAVTPVTVGKTIQTPKYVPPQGMAGGLGQDMPSTNHEVDAISHRSQRSHSQRSAFKPVKKRLYERPSAAQGGVTKTSDAPVTEQSPADGRMTLAKFQQEQVQSHSSNAMSPDEKRDLQNKINNASGGKDSVNAA